MTLNLKPNSEFQLLDEKTFEKFFLELYTPLTRYCLQFIRNPEIAEEIVQEQFINIWHKREELAIQTSVKSYLYTSVKNRAIDYLRTRFAKTHFVQEDVAIQIEDPVNIEHSIEEDEMSAAITKAVESLPEQCGIIFSMKRYGEFTNKQISEQLNISEKTVENQITIAYKRLRPILRKYLHLLALTIISINF